MRPGDLLSAARNAEAAALFEAERLADRERADIAAAKAEGAVLPQHHWQARWRAEERARAATQLRIALEEAQPVEVWHPGQLLSELP